jgi:hypothetical protein
MLATGARIAMVGSPPPSPSHHHHDPSTSTPPPTSKAKALALVDAVLTPIGFGAKSSATFHRQLSILMYGLGSCTFCVYSLGLNIDPALSHSLLGRWRPILHVILLYVGSVSDILVMGHLARNPEFGKFSYWSSDKYAKENRHILMESLSEGLVGWLFMVFLIWPIMCFGVTLAHISECRTNPMLESSFNVLIVPGLALNWLWAALWLTVGSMHFEYLQLSLKGLRDKLFERLRRGELSPEELIAGNSAFSFLYKEWMYLVVASNPTSLLMLMSVFVAIYDWVFSPWSSPWLMVWAVFYAVPSAYSFNAFIVNLKEEEKVRREPSQKTSHVGFSVASLPWHSKPLLNSDSLLRSSLRSSVR